MTVHCAAILVGLVSVVFLGANEAAPSANGAMRDVEAPAEKGKARAVDHLPKLDDEGRLILLPGPATGRWSAAMPPAAVDGTAGKATAVSAGGTHSCAILAGSNAVHCWGSDYLGDPFKVVHAIEVDHNAPPRIAFPD